MIRNEIEELLLQHPFEPFLIRVTSGERYEIRNSALAALPARSKPPPSAAIKP